MSIKFIGEKLGGFLGDIGVEIIMLGPLFTQHVGLQIPYSYSEIPIKLLLGSKESLFG